MGECPALDSFPVSVPEDLAAGGHDHVSVLSVLGHAVVIDGFPGLVHQLHLSQLLPIYPSYQRPECIS